MPLGRGLERGPGPWIPQYRTRSGPAAQETYFPKTGPNNLDLECKAALQQVLKPSHYGVIAPWMATARTDAKREVVKFAKVAAVGDADLKDPRTAFMATAEPVLTNKNGRARLASSVPCTADRMQSDLLRNRCGSDQRDTALEAKRRFFKEFVPVPSCSSVDDFHKLRDAPAASDDSTRVLNEQARRNLQAWQVRGPERDSDGAAQVMRSLRTLSGAVGALPVYHEYSRERPPGGEGCTTFLNEYSKAVPRGPKSFKAGSIPVQLQPSRSAPALLQPAPPLIEPEEIEKVSRPGGFLVNMFDHPNLQMLKNKERAHTSKITMAGGKCDYSTSYGNMMATW